MAESEGFEPPVPFRVRLISSQVHSTGLCQLSVLLIPFVTFEGFIFLTHLYLRSSGVRFGAFAFPFSLGDQLPMLGAREQDGSTA